MVTTAASAASPLAAARPRSELAEFLGHRWIMVQFRATGLSPVEQARLPGFLNSLGALPGADRTMILDPMVDLFRLSESTGYRAIPDENWAGIDAVVDAALHAGIPRVLPTLTFKIDPAKPALARFCAQMPGAAATGADLTVSAIANGSCLPAYADPDYQATFQALLAQAIKHFESRYGEAVIGYEPAGGVAGEIDWKGTDKAGQAVYGDVSPGMQQRFRTYLLAGQRPSASAVAQLNACLGTHFARADDIAIPTGPAPLAGPLGHQYAAFRAGIMSQFYRSARDTAKQLAPGKLFSLRMGALIDPTSALRGTLFFQQFAEQVQPDLMITDASTFNQNFEVPIVAGTGIGHTRAWGTVADKFSTYARKGLDYHTYVDRQLSVAIGSGGFSVIGFFMNPGEMAADDAGMAYLGTVTSRLSTAVPTARLAASTHPTVLPISGLLDDFSSDQRGAGTLKQIRSQTSDFQIPASIQFRDDVDESSASACERK